MDHKKSIQNIIYVGLMINVNMFLMFRETTATKKAHSGLIIIF